MTDFKDLYLKYKNYLVNMLAFVLFQTAVSFYSFQTIWFKSCFNHLTLLFMRVT